MRGPHDAAMTVTPASLDILQQHRLRILTDTGYCARRLLGWNYDLDDHGEKINVGTGGIRATGPHAKMVAFVDDPDMQFGVMEAPRGAMKSTVLQSLCVRSMLLEPNIRILYGMKTDEKAIEQAGAIQRALMMPEVEELFGKQRGDASWEAWRFTIAGRTKMNLMEPTFRTFTLESLPVGGHYDIIIVDDLIDHENCKTQAAMDNALKIVRMLFPLRDKGAKTIFVGTRYGDGDIYGELERNPLYKKLILKAGVRVVVGARGDLDLEVGPDGITFQHLNLPHLKKALRAMSAKGNWFDFSCQYLNEVPVGLTTPFRREHFKTTALYPEQMAGMTGYLLTDTATSMKEAGCYSVIAYVLMDQLENYYLVDVRVGHWRPVEFVNHYFSVLQQWSAKVNHQGEVWEQISLSSVYKSMIDADARTNKIRTRYLELPRSGHDVLTKRSRILRLEAVMRTGRFHIDPGSVARHFMDLDGERELFNPEGYFDTENNVHLPSGELIDEFIRLGAPGMKTDIADALAMLLENDRQSGRPHCIFKRPRSQNQDGYGLPESRNGQQTPGAPGLTDWWERTLKQHEP